MEADRFRVVANIPYNITNPIVARLIEYRAIIRDAVLMVQKEVADRMVATPGGKDYGTISIIMAATGKAKIIRKLSPSVFWPRPQVDSAMVTYQRQSKKVAAIKDMELLLQTVSLFMGHRRKMLKACVKFAEGRLAGVHHWTDVFDRAFVESHLRPEQLSAENYISIANLCHEILA